MGRGGEEKGPDLALIYFPIGHLYLTVFCARSNSIWHVHLCFPHPTGEKMQDVPLAPFEFHPPHPHHPLSWESPTKSPHFLVTGCW